MSKFNRKSLALTAGGVAAVAAAIAFHPSAVAQVAPGMAPAKAAVVNLQKVLTDDKGFAAVKNDLAVKAKNLADIVNGHQAQLKVLEGKRQQDHAGTQAYEDDTKALEEQGLKFKSDDSYQQFLLQRDQAQAIKKVYESVSAAASSVAKREGIDLVMVDSGDEIPAGAVDSTPDAMQQIIGAHLILYKSDRIDITAKVSAEMEALRLAPPAPAPAH
jgi:Skp family chaperone for outer membrane proteins